MLAASGKWFESVCVLYFFFLDPVVLNPPHKIKIYCIPSCFVLINEKVNCPTNVLIPSLISRLVNRALSVDPPPPHLADANCACAVDQVT